MTPVRAAAISDVGQMHLLEFVPQPDRNSRDSVVDLGTLSFVVVSGVRRFFDDRHLDGPWFCRMIAESRLDYNVAVHETTLAVRLHTIYFDRQFFYVMAKITIVFGIILIALGVVGYSGSTPSAAQTADSPNAEESTSAADSATDDPTTGAAETAGPAKKSVTALIPAFFGIGLLICGIVALKESLLKHAMHGAAMLGLLGTLAGTGRGAMGLGKFFSGDPSLNQRSFLFVWLMAVICGLFVFLCVRSFINARKRREQETASA